MKHLIIMRGVSGSGKTTLACLLEGLSEDTVFEVCADDYFHDPFTGRYYFDASKLDYAHTWCRFQVRQALQENYDVVIVHNTNTTEKEVNEYIQIAKLENARYFVITVENWNNTKNMHDVPEKTLERQRNRLKASIKL